MWRICLGEKPEADSHNAHKNCSQNPGCLEASSSWTPCNHHIVIKVRWCEHADWGQWRNSLKSVLSLLIHLKLYLNPEHFQYLHVSSRYLTIILPLASLANQLPPNHMVSCIFSLSRSYDSRLQRGCMIFCIEVWKGKDGDRGRGLLNMHLSMYWLV